jgi:hypothetical protein
MTTGSPSRHHRHLIELASILATAGLADAFADVFGMRRHGAGALIGLGVALVVGTVGHHIWLRRTDHAPPAPRSRPARATAYPVPPPFRGAGPDADAADLDSAEAEAAGAYTYTYAAGDPAAGDDESVLRAGTVWRVRTEIDDTPGRLAVFAGALAAAGANIHALEAHPTAGGVVDEFVVEASLHTTAEQLCGAVRAAGGRSPHAAPADVLALLDAPTRALDLAGRLVRRSASLAAVLADLLDAHSVVVGEASEGQNDAGPAGGFPAAAAAAGVSGGAHTSATGGVGGVGGVGVEGTTLRLLRPDGGLVTLTRPGMPFTATESARAQSMLDLHADLAAESGARTHEGGPGRAEVRTA